jgi:hypothetical protein
LQGSSDKRGTIMIYRTLGKSGLRVSGAALGATIFGDECGCGSPKDEAQTIYETYREADGKFIDTADLALNLDAQSSGPAAFQLSL